MGGLINQASSHEYSALNYINKILRALQFGWLTFVSFLHMLGIWLHFISQGVKWKGNYLQVTLNKLALKFGLKFISPQSINKRLKVNMHNINDN